MSNQLEGRDITKWSCSSTRKVRPAFKVRDATSLNSLFQSLASILKQTGEGEMSEMIRLAKDINTELHNMIDAGPLEGPLEEDGLPDETADCLEEALHEGPEPG